MGRSRAHADEHAERLNEALALLEDRAPAAVVHALKDAHGVSERQARRYVRAAEELTAPVPVPERTEVFTVRLPPSLVARVRERARAGGDSVSGTVTNALCAGLAVKQHERGRGTAC